MSSQEIVRQAGASHTLKWASSADLPTLELEDIEHEDQALLIARGSAYVKEVVRIEDATTTLNRNIAVVLLALRKQLDDLTGKSHEYRQLAAQVYSVVPSDDRTRVQANVRYHMSNVLRRNLTPRELRRAGLQPTSALERQQDTRATQKALVTAAKIIAIPDAELVSEPAEPKKTPGRKPKGGEVKPATAALLSGAEVKATADHLRLAGAARSILSQMRPDVIETDMTDGQRAKLDEELAAISKAIAELRKHTRKSRSAR
ncbi:hypothetical protein AQJ23_44850 [Streptomyces antibioticus]|nr:hypothetical protein [Streptomyces antibioticus]KUN16526.1 hypothetical protein AQJ23_44850 [Streptomyces antibioticus]